VGLAARAAAESPWSRAVSPRPLRAQAAVDGERGVIVAAELTNVAPDEGHLPALVARVRALPGRPSRARKCTLHPSSRQRCRGTWI